MTGPLVVAHGLGGRSDLPVPLSFFVAGAAVVLVFSFAALAARWPVPRLQDGPRFRPLPGGGVFAAAAAALSMVGVLSLAMVVVVGVAGEPGANRNPAPALMWIGFWLVIPFLSIPFGNLYRPLNPWRTASTVLGLGKRERADMLSYLGVWPAVVAFFGVTFLELVWPEGSLPRLLAVAAVVYSLYLIIAVATLGLSTGLQVADAFTTCNRLFSAVSPFGYRDGRFGWRGWLRALPVLPAWPGLTMFVIVMIGTVTYDGLSGTPWWRANLGSFSSRAWGGALLMAAVVAVIWSGYLLACKAASALAGGSPRGLVVARRFAHTLVPIAIAYAFAHYFTLVIFEGQLLWITLSDPFGLGWNLFGGAGASVNYDLMSPIAVWYVQLGSIVFGHILAVVLAHDRALADFPSEFAVRSQYAMLGLMVLLTGLGLTILAAG